MTNHSPAHARGYGIGTFRVANYRIESTFMAVLKQLPSEAIISGFKGVIDFYLWKDIPVARKWPIWRRRQPYPAEKANQDAFKYAMQTWKILPNYIKDQYVKMAASTSFRPQDIYLRAYMRGIVY